jgi:Toastrack DUF4097
MARTILSALIICTLVALVPVHSFAKTHRYDLEETYTIAKDGTLFLNTDDAEVTIIGEDRDDVLVEIHHEWHISGVSTRGGDDFEIVVTEENGNLRIREADTGGITIMMGSIHEEYTVDIKAPSSVNLRIRGDDDDYRIRRFSGEVRLDFEDGNAQLLDMSGSKFEIGIEDGDLELEGGTGMLDLYIEDGSATVEDGSFSEISSRVEDGDITIFTTLADGGDYRMRAEDGSVELGVTGGGGEFRLLFEDGGTRVGRDFDLVDEDDDYEEYTLEGGTASVRMEVEDGRITLRKR